MALVRREIEGETLSCLGEACSFAYPEALNLPAQMGAMVDRGASGATSRLTLNFNNQ